jgi:hypothetical protein
LNGREDRGRGIGTRRVGLRASQTRQPVERHDVR